jgi:hypothetical protein
VFLLVLAVAATPGLAQQPMFEARSQDADVAFVNVSVIPMDRKRVEIGQIVLVRGDRIVAVGPAHEVPVPESATVIDGTGRYLVPGLTDAHVHITTDMPWARARPNFGEAPLYLAYGITTIVNLHGTPAQLEWKRRIAAGELLGPTIYTSGEHVHEPRVKTPADATREVKTQAREGYDLIKFHEISDPDDDQRTTRGLSRPTYLQINKIAREIGIPVVGHAPLNLGYDALLQSRQSLSHVQALFPIYFFPVSSSRWILFTNTAALLALVGVAVMSAQNAGRQPGGTATREPDVLSGARTLTGLLLIGGLIALSVQVDEYFNSSIRRTTLLTVFSVLAVFVAVVTMALLVVTVRLSREVGLSLPRCQEALLGTVAGGALALALTLFWVPAAWRYTDSGIDRAAWNLREAGIAVQTTLLARDLAAKGADGWRLMQQDPAIDYLAPGTRRRWRQSRPPPVVPPEIAAVTRKVTSALHRAGVLLVAGSDAMGRPLIAPGSSLHRELELLTQSGLTPYEAVRTATVNPAILLREQQEFGTIAVGMRADLLLVDGNPFQDLKRLEQPLGVMVRGRWLTRERLQELLAPLASTS